MPFLDYNIPPAPGYENKKFPDGSKYLIPVFEENKSLYSTNSYFPGKYGEIIETGYVRNQPIVRIIFLLIKGVKTQQLEVS